MKLGDKLFGGKVVAIGIRDGERYVMTKDRHGTVGLWPEGSWDDGEEGRSTKLAERLNFIRRVSGVRKREKP